MLGNTAVAPDVLQDAVQLSLSRAQIYNIDNRKPGFSAFYGRKLDSSAKVGGKNSL
jgi:hypothetical protein